MTSSPSSPARTELEVRQIAPQLTACVRLHVAPDALAAAFSEHLPRIAERVHELGGSIVGPPYARYFRWGWDHVDLEIGAPIAALIPSLPEAVTAERGAVAGGELPGGRAAVLMHTGPYDQLGESWQRLEELMAAGRLVSAACGWEHYIDEPGTVAPEELRTELIHPIV